MAKTIVLNAAAVVLGLVVGMVVMMGLHLASNLIYAPPEGVSFFDSSAENQERMKEWFGTLPAGAFVLAVAAHGLGCMAGAAVAMLISGRRTLVTPLIVGVFFTIAGIMNLSSIPHPSWFPFVDVPIYLILALAAGLLLKRNGDQAQSEAGQPE